MAAECSVHHSVGQAGFMGHCFSTQDQRGVGGRDVPHAAWASVHSSNPTRRVGRCYTSHVWVWRPAITVAPTARHAAVDR
jgi:hypothetical protein